LLNPKTCAFNSFPTSLFVLYFPLPKPETYPFWGWVGRFPILKGGAGKQGINIKSDSLYPDLSAMTWNRWWRIYGFNLKCESYFYRQAPVKLRVDDLWRWNGEEQNIPGLMRNTIMLTIRFIPFSGAHLWILSYWFPFQALLQYIKKNLASCLIMTLQTDFMRLLGQDYINQKACQPKAWSYDN